VIKAGERLKISKTSLQICKIPESPKKFSSKIPFFLKPTHAPLNSCVGFTLLLPWFKLRSNKSNY
jgi:hypothetical protein